MADAGAGAEQCQINCDTRCAISGEVGSSPRHHGTVAMFGWNLLDVVTMLGTTRNDPWRVCGPNCSSAVRDVLLSNAGQKFVHRGKMDAS